VTGVFAERTFQSDFEGQVSRKERKGILGRPNSMWKISKERVFSCWKVKEK
jgi:hypothetical protein